LELRVAVTRNAERFVTRGALGPMSGGNALLDAWPDGPVDRALHVELAEWADTVIVHPASLHFLARLAQGLADTPVLLALQCTTAPVVLAPALPPGAERRQTRGGGVSHGVLPPPARAGSAADGCRCGAVRR
jgi:phosphopantothenoylcysteine decarboxylase/phosphopantothenate--cysteine ligase